MLKIDNLSFSYGEHWVIENLSLDIDSGSLVALLGKNGSGKSTLIRLILGLLKPNSGTIELDGMRSDSLSFKERSALMSYIPQKSDTVYPSKVIDYVVMAFANRLRLYSHPGKKERDAALNALKEVGIESLSEKNVMEISGGEMQLSMIARSLCQNSKIILMDEPTSSLDFSNQIAVLERLRALKEKGITLIYSTHNPDLALEYSDRILLMKDGKTRSVDNKDELLDGRALSEIYGRKIEVKTIEANGKKRHICIAL